MPTIHELREQRASIWAHAQEFNERHKAGETMSAEDEASWSRALEEVDALGRQIDNRETSESLEQRFSEIDSDTIVVENGQSRSATEGDRDAYRDAFRNYCRFGFAGMSAEERQLIESNFSGSNARALGTSGGSAGGYTVPEGFWAKVTETMKHFGGAAEGAEVLTTTSGNPIPWPTNNDTANVGYLLSENSQAASEGDLSFGQAQLDAFTFVSGPGLISKQLIQDSGIDIESFVARKMGERLGRAKNAYFTTGSGSSQPQGYVTGATTGKTTNSGTAITYDEIIDLVHSVDAAYRASGRCQFKMHDLVLAYLRKLRDDSGGSGIGRPLWEPSVQAGQPDTLLGYPYVVNNDMASVVQASAKTVAFGDFQSAFVVRSVAGGELMRLEERYADYLQVGFIAYERADSVVQDASAVKLLVQKA